MKYRKNKKRETTFEVQYGRLGRRSLVSYLAACLAAILSCFCCTIPIALSALGFSDLVDVPVFQQYNWVFNALAGLTMLTGLFFLWYHHSHQHTKLWDDLELWLACLFMKILFGVLSLGTNTVLSKYSNHQHNNGHEQHLRSDK